MTPANGVYEIRLHLPEALRGNQGLQVAYYNEKTGMLTVLDTEIDGNDLVFRSNKSGISDFIILGDTTVVMTSFIAALGLTLLCQLIAIVVLLVRRAKTSKSVRHCSLMLPLALTIRFLPENSMMLIFVLGILVVLAQIILMYLLFTSDVIYRKGKRVGNEPTEQRRERDGAPAEPADAPAPEVDDTTAYESISDEDTAVMVAFDDEEVEEDASQTDNEDEETTLDTPTEDLLEVEDESVAEDVFETEDESIVNDEAYDDFIEPAANPRYSLPDDEDLYVDTATGEIYSAAELNENDVILDDLETNEWDYDNASAEEEAEELSEDADAQNADASEWQYDDDPNEVAVSEDADTVLSDDDTKTYDGYEE